MREKEVKYMQYVTKLVSDSPDVQVNSNRTWTNVIIIQTIIVMILIYNTQMVAVALGPWASHSEDRAES